MVPYCSFDHSIDRQISMTNYTIYFLPVHQQPLHTVLHYTEMTIGLSVCGILLLNRKKHLNKTINMSVNVYKMICVYRSMSIKYSLKLSLFY